MTDKLNNFEGMLPYANSKEFADSLGENQSSKVFGQSNFTHRRKLEQEKVRLSDIEKAEKELNSKLSLFEEMVPNVLKEVETESLKEQLKDQVVNRNFEEEIMNLNHQLKKDKKPYPQILKTLISRYENEKSVVIWVKHWKNFLELHQIAETKPEKEKEAIQSILLKADFTSEESFSTALAVIYSSNDVSAATKREIKSRFRSNSIRGRSGNEATVMYKADQITSVKQVDRELKNIRKNKKKAKRDLRTLKLSEDKLTSEIATLEKELKDASDTDKVEINAELKAKKELQESNKKLSIKLENDSNQVEEIELRKEILIKRNTGGEEFLVHRETNFEISLPNSFLRFSDKSKRGTINFIFPFSQLRKLNIGHYLFKDKVIRGNIPTARNRKQAHFILKALGYNDDRILSEQNIQSLNKDLQRLTNYTTLKSGKDCLAELDILDKSKGAINKNRLKEVFHFLKENRSLSDDLISNKLKNRFIQKTKNQN